MSKLNKAMSKSRKSDDNIDMDLLRHDYELSQVNNRKSKGEQRFKNRQRYKN